MCFKRCKFVVACGVIRSVLINSATSDANLYGELFLSIFIKERRVFKILISLSTMPIER